MEKADFLREGNEVKVTVYGPEGSNLYESTGNGYHNIQAAIDDTLQKAGLNVNPEDCAFEVSNLTIGVSHRYRINAHGNLKLIV
ncbi:MAG: hypothetical protein J1E97_03140 [Muribaculaceae bacterium]|nr:hypothetical protein [Muribaculaceae bacterium]